MTTHAGKEAFAMPTSAIVAGTPLTGTLNHLLKFGPPPPLSLADFPLDVLHVGLAATLFVAVVIAIHHARARGRDYCHGVLHGRAVGCAESA